MAVLQRLESITEAKARIGRKAQNLSLVYAYDAITQLMTTRYPLIPHQRATGSCTSSQAYVTPPSVNIKRPEKMMIGTTLSEIEWLEPELFINFKGATNASPTKWTYMRDQTTPYSAKLIYLYPTPDSTYGYAFYYSVIQAKSTGNTFTHSMTEYFDETLVIGIMWKALEIVEQYGKALTYKRLFFKDLEERAKTFMKDFKVVE